MFLTGLNSQRQKMALLRSWITQKMVSDVVFILAVLSLSMWASGWRDIRKRSEGDLGVAILHQTLCLKSSMKWIFSDLVTWNASHWILWERFILHLQYYQKKPSISFIIWYNWKNSKLSFYPASDRKKIFRKPLNFGGALVPLSHNERIETEFSFPFGFKIQFMLVMFS